MSRFYDLPFIVILMGIGAAAMMVPAVYASVVNDNETARAFFYPSVLFSMLFGMVALATANIRIRRQGRSHLISIVACYAVLPVMLAVPFSEAVPDTTFLNAYVEMVSSLTTTGATLFAPERLPDAVHFWRAMVGWMGGFFVWVTAIAIMAPLNLGGFELTSAAEIGQGARESRRTAEPSERIRRVGARLFPVYLGLTVALWIALVVSGDRAIVGLVHSMSTLSTSGISVLGGLEPAGSGYVGEFIVFLFLIFALSRVTFVSEERPDGVRSLWNDPEIRLGLAITGTLAVLLFLRHWVVSFEDGTELRVLEGLRSVWGALFTVLSFLTTTGFVAADWDTAQLWSGVSSPGVLLVGLAVFGGGVATTAGGVKLLRVFSLYQHGLREMEKLVHPRSVGGSGRHGRRFRRQGAYAAWVFFMLFAISIALVVGAFTLVGRMGFEEAMILTIATLSTTGPLTAVAGGEPIDLAAYSEATKGIMCAAMILGRLEALAIIALLNPEFWR
ncbi:TrkH family potassium uptake protein [Silicimonas algicola]|uniref:Trk system potassium uptake protein TrkH n=1 Tax=Silicimonas algicola TaxID=1826607 RepID=A0A316GAN1_9RHOB|nr:potassium transporter TrkG [Silicimonas algicola]AZQ67913.1 TrkH family potassium uptake protein [Silicimonas algicola]PWK57653.1 trk system potassium uptake protein TrkH [Silicimonas algicola]